MATHLINLPSTLFQLCLATGRGIERGNSGWTANKQSTIYILTLISVNPPTQHKYYIYKPVLPCYNIFNHFMCSFGIFCDYVCSLTSPSPRKTHKTKKTKHAQQTQPTQHTHSFLRRREIFHVAGRLAHLQRVGGFARCEHPICLAFWRKKQTYRYVGWFSHQQSLCLCSIKDYEILKGRMRMVFSSQKGSRL